MADEQNAQDQAQDEITKSDDSSRELSEDELDTVAGGGSPMDPLINTSGRNDGSREG